MEYVSEVVIGFNPHKMKKDKTVCFIYRACPVLKSRREHTYRESERSAFGCQDRHPQIVYKKVNAS